MTNSILITIKKMLGLRPEDAAFDVDIISSINTAFMFLNQLGIGPDIVFNITDSSSVWTDFTTDLSIYSGVVNYIHLKVKLLFDPPTSTALLDAMTRQVNELESRLTYQVPIVLEETTEEV